MRVNLRAAGERDLLNPSSRAGYFRWVICGLLLLGTTKNYMDRWVLSALKTTLQHDLGWSEIAYSNIVFGFQAAYAIGMLVVGRFIDRFGTRLGYSLVMIFWSIASMAHAVGSSFSSFLAARVALGFGEAGVFPASIKAVAEWFPAKERALATGIFNAGTNVGVIVAGLSVPWITVQFGWRWAFYLVTPPGLLLGLLCFWQRDPRVAAHHLMQKSPRRRLADYLTLFRTRSYVINCIAQTLMTFAAGGLGYWVSAYLRYRNQSPAFGMTVFGLITVVAGLISTLLGGIVADKLRPRFAGSYFWVSGIGMVIACPAFIATLYIPFPAAWIAMFFAIFFLFLNTGPSNTALANVSLPAVRATAFAINILVIHALGDVQAFWMLGYIGGHTNMHVAFLFVSGIMLASGLVWLSGVKYLAADTAAVEAVTS